jgi:hypothetical protein
LSIITKNSNPSDGLFYWFLMLIDEKIIWSKIKIRSTNLLKEINIMPNFCPKCGEKINPEDKFCKSCGATLIESVEAPKEELRPEKPPTPIQISPGPSKPSRAWEIIKGCIQIVMVILFAYLIYYSYNCATGKYPNTQDRMCQSIYQSFRGGGGTTGGGGGTTGGGSKQISIGCQHCSPGYCYVEGHCCPSSAQYYCNGYCYRSSGEAYSAGCHQSGWTRYCCYQ